MKNPRISVSFENRILHVIFLSQAKIDVIDLVEIYAYANERAAGRPYGVIFESAGPYEVTDEGIYYLSNNPNSRNVLGKAYITNNMEAGVKTRLHLLFDKSGLRPFVFKTLAEGKAWLEKIVAERT